MVIMAGKTKRTPQQIGRASRQKGARFELEVAHYLQAHGYPDAHRTAQHCGKQEMQEMWKVSADYM